MFPMGLQNHVRNPRRSLVTTPVSSWGNFSPLAFNPQIWLDASDTTSITSSAGRVSQWNDKSGRARNLTQATGTNQPTTGSVTQNGLNTIGFNGSSHWIASTVFTMAPLRFSFLAVVVSLADKTTPIICAPSGGEGGVWSFSATSFNWQMYRTATAITSSTATAASTAYIIVGDMKGAASSIRINGAQILTGTVGTTSVNGLLIGRNASNTYLGGQVCEFVGVSDGLSTSAVTQWERYAAAKWGITI